MPSWSQLLDEFSKIPSAEQLKIQWINDTLQKYLNSISIKRNGRNIIFYSSAFLQKPDAPPMSTQITAEDLNGNEWHGLE